MQIVNKAALGKTSCIVLISPIILLALIEMHCICSSKLNFAFKKKRKCFCSRMGLSKVQWWVSFGTCFFWLNSNSWPCLLGSGLEFIFYCTAHSENFLRLLLRLTALVVISCMVENKVSLVKYFGLDCKPFGKSFM